MPGRYSGRSAQKHIAHEKLLFLCPARGWQPAAFPIFQHLRGLPACGARAHTRFSATDEELTGIQGDIAIV
jgi:hypothetical protein